MTVKFISRGKTALLQKKKKKQFNGSFGYMKVKQKFILEWRSSEQSRTTVMHHEAKGWQHGGLGGIFALLFLFLAGALYFHWFDLVTERVGTLGKARENRGGFYSVKVSLPIKLGNWVEDPQWRDLTKEFQQWIMLFSFKIFFWSLSFHSKNF